MPEDLIILQFLDIFSDFGNLGDWNDSWSVPVVIAFVLSVALEFWLLRKRKKKANFWIIVGVILAVIFCEYGYQATPGLRPSSSPLQNLSSCLPCWEQSAAR